MTYEEELDDQLRSLRAMQQNPVEFGLSTVTAGFGSLGSAAGVGAGARAPKGIAGELKNAFEKQEFEEWLGRMRGHPELEGPRAQAAFEAASEASLLRRGRTGIAPPAAPIVRGSVRGSPRRGTFLRGFGLKDGLIALLLASQLDIIAWGFGKSSEKFTERATKHIRNYELAANLDNALNAGDEATARQYLALIDAAISETEADLTKINEDVFTGIFRKLGTDPRPFIIQQLDAYRAQRDVLAERLGRSRQRPRELGSTPDDIAARAKIQDEVESERRLLAAEAYPQALRQWLRETKGVAIGGEQGYIYDNPDVVREFSFSGIADKYKIDAQSELADAYSRAEDIRRERALGVETTKERRVGGADAGGRISKSAPVSGGAEPAPRYSPQHAAATKELTEEQRRRARIGVPTGDYL